MLTKLSKCFKAVKFARFSPLSLTLNSFSYNFCSSTSESSNNNNPNALKFSAEISCRHIWNNDIPSQLSNLPKDIYDTLLEVQEKSGFIPNIFLILTKRPNEFRSFFQFYDALMKEENSELTIYEKEQIIVTTSALNSCLYCVVAHGAMLRVFSKKLENDNLYNIKSSQLSVDYKKANITHKQKLMLDFCCKLTKYPSDINDKDINELLIHGFSKEAIWDMAMITSYFSMSNRIAHFSGLMPNNEFYEIGRNPIKKE